MESLNVTASIAGTREGAATSGTIEVETLTETQLKSRALKLLLKFWGGAIVSVIFPLVHFVLVPGLFLAGPIVAYFSLNQRKKILGGTTSCPKCNAPIKIQKAPYNDHVSALCKKCYTEISIRTVIGLLLCTVASAYPTPSLAYYGRIATEASLTFNGEIDTPIVLVPRGLSSLNRSGQIRNAALEAVDAQIQHLMGTFQSISFAEAFSYPGVLGESYEIRFTSLTAGSTRHRMRLGYEFTGTVVFDKRAFARQATRNIPIKLPLQPDTIYSIAEQGNLHACTDHHYDSEDDFWYFWDPDQEGCSLQDDQTHVYRTQGRLTVLPNTTSTYPEYDRLYGDNGNGSELKISIFLGYINDVESLTQPMRRDWGMRSYRDVQRFLRENGFTVTESRDAFRLRSNGTVMRGINFWSEFQKQVGDMNVVVEVLVADTMVMSNDGTFHAYYVNALRDSDVVLYDGHSGLGGNLHLDNLPQISFRKNKYQILFFNGCSSYPYFNGMYFDAKGGSKNLDVVTSGLPTIVDTGGPNMNTFITSLIDGKLWSWQTILAKLERSNGENGTYLVGVKGDEDNAFRP